jgi:TetR/AcrR family transcriptional repressor of mexJK operon
MSVAEPVLARPRKSGRPPAAIAARLPMLLLDAAERRFLAQGYGATSIEQIALDVGATKRTIYAKFGDKAGLFSAMAKRVVERRRARLSGEFAGGTVDARLTNFGMQLIELALAPDVLSLHRVIVAEAHRFPEIVLLVDELAAQGVRRRLAEIIAAEAAGGALVVADAGLAADLLIGMILNAAVHAGLLGRGSVAASRPARWVRAAVSVFLDGCRRGVRAQGGTM